MIKTWSGKMPLRPKGQRKQVQIKSLSANEKALPEENQYKSTNLFSACKPRDLVHDGDPDQGSWGLRAEARTMSDVTVHLDDWGKWIIDSGLVEV